ncbi:MAG: hypothetical protein MI810_11195 [Flavobacteriales bacterium]|nr:hypothetical protein [Flavobacteriales bacterium]
MKKLYLLIAPIAFLASCSGTKQVYDDTYEAAVKPEKSVEKENDDLGYQDYIKNYENQYEVEVDSSTQQTSTKSSYSDLGGSYYSGDDIIVNNYYGNGYGNGYSNFNNGWGGANVNVFVYNDPWYRYNRWGWSNYYRPGYYNSWYYDSWNYGWGNPYYGWNAPYYGWNNPYYAWNNPYYGWGNPYYGGFYDPWGYNPYWDPWYNPYCGYPYNGWNSPVSNGNGGGFTDNTIVDNHYYGHRGGVATESVNTSTYEHTIKTGKPGSGKPFAAYEAAEELASISKPVNQAATNNLAGASATLPTSNTGRIDNTTSGAGANNPIKNTNGQTATNNFAGKPSGTTGKPVVQTGNTAQNNNTGNGGVVYVGNNKPNTGSTGKTKPANNSGTMTFKPANNQFATTSKNTNNSYSKPKQTNTTSTSKPKTTYSGNKYYTQSESKTTTTKTTSSGSRYNNGNNSKPSNYSTGSSSRSNSGNRYGGGSYNSGSSNRSGSSGSYNRGGSSNRSSGSSGSSSNRSGSSGGSSKSTGSSSRRR